MAAVAAAMLAGCGSSSTTTGASGAGTPGYRVTQDQRSGDQHFVTVEVDSTQGLRAVLDAVLATHHEDGGYVVAIDCSTGGTWTASNRLANGRAARGSKGAAATGLKDGQVEFTTVAGRTCTRARPSTSTSGPIASKSSKRVTRSAAVKRKTRR